MHTFWSVYREAQVSIQMSVMRSRGGGVKILDLYHRQRCISQALRQFLLHRLLPFRDRWGNSSVNAPHQRMTGNTDYHVADPQLLV